MSIDNTSSSQDVESASLTTRTPISAGLSRSPRHVQWASKPQVEHVEQISHSHSDEEDPGVLARTLDEHGSDVSSSSLSVIPIISHADYVCSISLLHWEAFTVRWKII
jgi:hypothetical protein